MSAIETATRTFLESIEPAGRLWQSVDVRVAAVKIGDAWHNLFTRCYLDGREPGDLPRFPHLPADSSFCCRQFTFEREDLPALLGALATGEVTYDDSWTVGYEEISRAAEPKPWTHAWTSYHTISDYWGTVWSQWGGVPYIFWSAETFGATGESILDLLRLAELDIRKLDNTLRVGEYPVDGLDGVAQYYVGFHDPLDPHRNASFEVIAPYEGILDETGCRCSEDTLHVRVRIGSSRVRPDLSIGVFAWGPDPIPLSISLPLESVSWEPVSGGQACTIEIPLGDFNVQAADVMLRLGSRCVYKTLVGGPAELANVRQKSYELFDPDLDHFRSSLDPSDASRASEFERAVGRLFHFLGFSVNVLSGEGRITEAVDTLAFSSHPSRCFAIECTTGSIDAGGKLGKLVSRVNRLSDTLGDVPVHGVIATALPKDRLAEAEKNAADADQLIVLTQEDLRGLLGAISPSASTIAAIPYLLGKIPTAAT